ncbi:MAG TPA: hypothetical protein VFA59_19870 [Vicinamibacterales bacterium]|nr:hypothetical protein [Vicinamibacterales bacterium]
MAASTLAPPPLRRDAIDPSAVGVMTSVVAMPEPERICHNRIRSKMRCVSRA